jgi:TatD DNase family protein
MSKNYLIDSHCHLDLIEKSGISLTEIIENCQKNNVKILQTICTRPEEIDNLIKYCDNYDFIYSSFGLHPCNVDKNSTISSSQIIETCQKHVKIIGIGETGLDYFHDLTFVKEQKKSFLEHIFASQKNLLPLIIHSRDADSDMADILTIEQKNLYFPALLHCFSSSKELAKKALDLNIFISISGIITFKNATSLQEIVKYIPLDYLLIETDSPYLAPIPFRGKVNQPTNVKFVADFIAELKNISVEEVYHQTSENFYKIFTKAKIL